MMNKNIQVWLVRSLLLLVALAASPAFALEKMTLQLNWFHQFQFAGYYAAVEQGYYRKAGLDVAISETVPGNDPIATVLTGKADFGVGGSNLLQARGGGKPVVFLAAIFQHSPQVLLARKLGQNQALQDLAGKRVMLDSQSDELLAYFRKEGLGPDRFSQVAHSYNPMDLGQGKVDAMSGSMLNEMLTLDKAHYAYHAYQPRSAGLDFYGDVLFAMEPTIKARPDQVRAFREASLLGWKYAMSHQAEIADLIIAKYSKRLDREMLLNEAKQIQALMEADKIEVGSLNGERLQRIADAYASIGKMPKDASIKGLIYDPTPPPKKDMTPFYIMGGGIAALILVALAIAGRLVFVSIVLKRERKKVGALQAQLKASEESFRGLFTAMDSGFALNELICGPDGKPVDYRFLEVNPAFEKVTGMSRDKLIGKRVKEVLPSMGDEWIAKFGEVALTGQPKQFENFSQKTCRWFATHAFSPAPGRFAVVNQEITERKQMEISLAKANTELSQKYDEISQLQEKLREQAIRDPLTGLYNRRYLDETIVREISRAKRENYSLCVLLVDIDFFKKVNDTYGHLAGDEVLKAFGHLLQDCSRKEDVPCRYGGEEFLFMAPKMPVEVAEQRANMLREKFAQMAIPFGETEIRATLSIGIAVYPDHGLEPHHLTNCADQALYACKSQGRNRVIIYKEGM